MRTADTGEAQQRPRVQQTGEGEGGEEDGGCAKRGCSAASRWKWSAPLDRSQQAAAAGLAGRPWSLPLSARSHQSTLPLSDELGARAPHRRQRRPCAMRLPTRTRGRRVGGGPVLPNSRPVPLCPRVSLVGASKRPHGRSRRRPHAAASRPQHARPASQTRRHRVPRPLTARLPSPRRFEALWRRPPSSASPLSAMGRGVFDFTCISHHPSLATPTGALLPSVELLRFGNRVPSRLACHPHGGRRWLLPRRSIGPPSTAPLDSTLPHSPRQMVQWASHLIDDHRDCDQRECAARGNGAARPTVLTLDPPPRLRIMLISFAAPAPDSLPDHLPSELARYARPGRTCPSLLLDHGRPTSCRK